MKILVDKYENKCLKKLHLYFDGKKNLLGIKKTSWFLLTFLKNNLKI